MNRTRRAFTLIELIVVIVIIGILAGIAAVSYRSVVDKSEQKVFEANQTAVARDTAAILAFNDGTSPSMALAIAISEGPGALSPGALAAACFTPPPGGDAADIPDGWDVCGYTFNETTLVDDETLAAANEVVWSFASSSLRFKVASDKFVVTCSVTTSTSSCGAAGDTADTPDAAVPAAPAAPTGVATGPSSIDVTFTAPSDPGSSAVTSYRVTASPGGLTATASSPGTLAVSGLTPSVDYKFSVAARNAAGWSAESPLSATVATEPVPGLTGLVSLFAGGQNAAFSETAAMAVADDGTIYFTERDGSAYASPLGNRIRAYHPSTNTISTLAGSTDATPGYVDATGTAARFSNPGGIAIGPDGNIYVADADNRVIRMVTPAGVVTTVAGTGSTPMSDGPLASANIFSPGDLAFDATGVLYFRDGAYIRTADFTAGTLTTIAGVGGFGAPSDGPAASASVYAESMTFDAAGTLWFAQGYDGLIRKLDVATMIVTTVAGEAGHPGEYADGTGTAARFNDPIGLAFDAAGDLYVSEAGGAIRQMNAAGVVTTVAGTNGSTTDADGSGAAAEFNSPRDIALQSDGSFAVLENTGLRQMTSAGVVTTLAGTGTAGYLDGQATGVLSFGTPVGTAFDAAGSLYFSDLEANVIRKVDTVGNISTYAGSGAYGSVDNADPLLASFSSPAGVAIDSLGNMYVSDTGGASIRKIAATGAVTTLAPGAGTMYGLAIDSHDVLYGADVTHNTILRIDTTTGAVTTFAGNGSSVSVDNADPLMASFGTMYALTVDDDDNIFISDTTNGRIRKIDAVTHAVTTLASGVSYPAGITVTPDGTVYFSSVTDNTISAVSPAGVVSAFVGGNGSYAEGLGSAAGMSFAYSMVTGPDGHIYFGDSSNHRIREIS